MLHTTSDDAQKLLTKLKFIIGATTEVGYNKVVVKFNDFYESCQFSKLRKSLFAAEVEDMLTGTEFTRVHGTWVFADLGDGYHIFIQLAEAGTSGQVNDLLERGAIKHYVF